MVGRLEHGTRSTVRTDPRLGMAPYDSVLAPAAAFGDLSVVTDGCGPFWTAAARSLKNSAKDLRIARGVDRITVDRFDQDSLQPKRREALMESYAEFMLKLAMTACN
jgi:hypothetical protein